MQTDFNKAKRCQKCCVVLSLLNVIKQLIYWAWTQISYSLETNLPSSSRSSVKLLSKWQNMNRKRFSFAHKDFDRSIKYFAIFRSKQRFIKKAKMNEREIERELIEFKHIIVMWISLVNTFRWFSIRIDHQISHSICHFVWILRTNHSQQMNIFLSVSLSNIILNGCAKCDKLVKWRPTLFYAYLNVLPSRI